MIDRSPGLNVRLISREDVVSGVSASLWGNELCTLVYFLVVHDGVTGEGNGSCAEAVA